MSEVNGHAPVAPDRGVPDRGVPERQLLAVRLSELDAVAGHLPREVAARRVLWLLLREAGMKREDVPTLAERIAELAVIEESAPKALLSLPDPVEIPVAKEPEPERKSKAKEQAKSAKPSVNLTEKTCTRCGEAKPIDQFNRSRQGAGGRRSQCKTCHAAYQRDWKRRKQTENRPEPESEPPKVTVQEKPSRILKWCESCDRRKPLTSFDANRNTPDGRTHACTACLKRMRSNHSFAMGEG